MVKQSWSDCGLVDQELVLLGPTVAEQTLLLQAAGNSVPTMK